MEDASGADRSHFGSGYVALFVVAVLQIAWVGWWLVEPLPNSGNIRPEKVRRGVLVMRAIPEIVPGVTYGESGLGQAIGELTHVENLPQRGPIVLVAAWIALAGIGLGDLTLRGMKAGRGLSVGETIPLSFGLGMIVLALATLGLGRLGMLHPWAIRCGLAGLSAWGLIGLVVRRAAETAPAPVIGAPNPYHRSLPVVGFLLVTAPFLVLMALAAMLPTIDFDALEYHLQGPKEWHQGGRIAFLPHNVYTAMPFGVEMLHLLGMIALGDWWRGALVGQLLVMIHAPMAAAMIGMAASRIASPRAGWFASMAYLTTPWVFRLAALPYVEGPMNFYHAALIWAVVRGTGGRWWGVIGLLAGGAMACKYPALISAVIPFGLMAARTRSPKAVIGFALGVSVAIGPWLIKNVADTGNPVYPLANSVFGGHPWSASREAKWRNAHGPKPPSIASAADGLVDIAGRSDWQSGLYLALAPLAVFRRGSRKISLVLWGYFAYIFATWYLFTHRLDRFWLPVLPPLAILAGLGADWRRGLSWWLILAPVASVITLTNLTL